ncbi:hypothetical protein KP509_07G076300 [Ceratopteris richardii]|uniref:PRONE domain-containing protein n=1 Tax=Ceratopteris richardii TaxID=49495 RepID=A0A8T2UBC9_CERRI|nr:hypothetical protein KP509_07G076300 [Ceratopteris richardii]KAH7433592.1 hypothetical protein KP509_07G076300 [Ceratopteris richardii]KAH7433593.1 hypothetical protein KP509_07G076300 [Ceratopteris richardii]KAH7433594.1 hypothetical protein KP509_07G076300 [Ceratopteris richardii]
MLKSIRSWSLQKPAFDVLPDESPDRPSVDGTSSTASFDRFCADILADGSIPGSPRDAFWDDDESSTSASESSPIGWPRSSKHRLGKLYSLPKYVDSREASGRGGEANDAVRWGERRDRSGWMEQTDSPSLTGKNAHKPEENLSEIDMMKERFAKLLLGEDASGGSKGVSSALAISNAITNLAASIFGELVRLEPLVPERKARWQREMNWLLAVCDHIVEFVPSKQTLPDGSINEVMITKIRTDIRDNLPGLRKLDNMLLETLDSFGDTEFWYIDRAVAMAEKDGVLPFRQEEKWWLPVPRVPAGGLPAETRRHLQHHRDNVNQVLKAVLATNAQVLSDMEVPEIYRDSLPKNAKSSLGDPLYRLICSENFSPEMMIGSIDSSHEHNILELVNRVEAALHIWRRKLQDRQLQGHTKDGRSNSKLSWGLTKDGATDLGKRELMCGRAETLLMLLRHKFPGIPQTILDMTKIQYNKDIGQSVLESYSRVLESLAYNVLSKINDVLRVDDVVKCNLHPSLTGRPQVNKSRDSKSHGQLPPLSPPTYYSGLPKSASVPNASFYQHDGGSEPELSGWNAKVPLSEVKEFELYTEPPRLGSNKLWSYSDSVNALRSPPSRD